MHFHHCFFNCPIKTASQYYKVSTVSKVDKCHVCFFNVCFSLFPVDGSFPNYMLNKDKFGPGQNFYVWPQVEEAPRQQLWLRKRKYNFACISVIYKLYEIVGSKVFSYSGSVPPLRGI